MFDPRFIWTGIALIAALYLGYKTLMPAPPPAKTEAVAFLRSMQGSNTRVTKITRSQCRSMKQRLWAPANDEAECIAYITPTVQPKGTTALVFFHGDFPAKDQTASRMKAARVSYRERAAKIASTYNVPVYVIGRPGVMGSTGFHVIGGVRAENAIMEAALYELKRRYGIKDLVLGGQSGGARLTAQLLASRRTDIKCAVMASGAYGIPLARGGGRQRTNVWGQPSRSYLIPLRSLTGVKYDRKRRLFVVGDPKDKRTPFPEQQEWAEALQRAGHHAVLLRAPARGKEFHSLSVEGLRIAGMCAADKSDREIQAYVSDLNARAKRNSKAPRKLQQL